MFSRRSSVKSRLVSARRITGYTALLLAALLAARTSTTTTHANRAERSLDLAERVTAARAVEEVYWRHRIWPQDNPQPKPPLSAVLPHAVISARVEDSLRQSQALAERWQQPLTHQQLQDEIDRQARHTASPAVLRELWAALGNDPYLIAECLVRPALAEQQLREQMPEAVFETWWREERAAFAPEAAISEDEDAVDYYLPEIGAQIGGCFTEGWSPTRLVGAPSPRSQHTAVWTGSEMIVWGGLQSASSNIHFNTGGRYDPATDTWSSTSTVSAPSRRRLHTAVWTGREMIIWSGGEEDALKTGARYNPLSNTWNPTSTVSAPYGGGHTAVWTGREMIVWGDAGSAPGGRYDPERDAWTAISTSGAPTRRVRHSAVWTGSQMIVWGGWALGDSYSHTGGLYTPATNTWTTVNPLSAPSGRQEHTAVWTGSEMIVWGGITGSGTRSVSGGRYHPATNTWLPTNTANVPNGFVQATAVWTGSEMIIWGGSGVGGLRLQTGGRYHPLTDSWTAINPVAAPAGRSEHTAVWTGSAMIVWGGRAVVNSNGNTDESNTGGRYALAPTLALTPASQVYSALGGTGGARVAAPGACTWRVTSSADWLRPTGPTTGAGDGGMSFSVAPNPATNPRTATLTVGPQTFVVAQAAAIPNPVLATSVSAASFNAQELAPDAIVAAFGSGLAPRVEVAASQPLPTNLAGTTIRITDRAGQEHAAPLFFVSPTQVNYLMPSGVASGEATIFIISSDGNYSQGTVQIAPVAPGLFAANANGQGAAAALVLRLKADGTQSYEPVAQFDAARQQFIPTPIDVGPEGEQLFLVLYGTGLRGRSGLAAATATIGGLSAEVLFVGAQPGFAGLDQCNVRLPRALAGRGEVDLILTLDGKASNAVRVNVK